MKIDLPATLTAAIDYVYPESMNWADPTMHPTPYVVVSFGTYEVTRVPLTEEQTKRLDPYSHHREEEEQDIANEVAAKMLASLFEQVRA